MTKRASDDELHRTVAGARLRIQQLEDEIKKEEVTVGCAQYDARQTFVVFTQTDPETLERWTFWITEDHLVRLRALAPKLGAASWVTDLYDSAVDAIGKSLDLTWQPGYAAAVDAKVADIRARWRRYIGERMCEAVFPGGSVFYFADRRTALRFEGEYQRLVDAQCRVMRLAPRCVRPEAFKERMRRLEKTRLVSDCTNLYTPGLEPEFRKDMEEDAMEYVRRLMAADAKK